MAALLLAACTPHAPAATTPARVAIRNDIHWFRSSAEYRGIALEVYRAAGERLAELSRAMPGGTWGVIMDIDETLLDNSLSEREDADRGTPFSDSAWVRWILRRAATAIPGSVEFTRQVHAAGGRVVLVTNRSDSLCAPTRDNLRAVGVEPDILLCQVGAESDKNPRFTKVQSGHAVPGIGPLTIVEWIGDNIQDFPRLSQDVRNTPEGYREFGMHYFLLPNPMYGSWVHNVEP